MGETKGKRLGTLRCRGLKPPVLRGHAAAFKYWFDAFGHSGPYSQDIQEIDGVQKVIPKGNPMESPGESPCCCCFPEFFSVKGIFYHEFCRCQKDNEAVNQKGSQANKIRHTKGPCALWTQEGTTLFIAAVATDSQLLFENNWGRVKSVNLG